MRHVLLLACGAACDSTFSLVHVPDPVPVDTVDARSPCWNPDQIGDEDSDAILDGCDQCPADAMGSTDDLDGDVVGDLCDPYKSEPGDVLVDFDGFTTQRLWEPQVGDWTFAPSNGGAMRTASSTLIASTELTTAVAKHPTLDVILDGDSGIGIYMKIGATNQVVTCEHVMGSAPTPDRIVLSIDGDALPPVDLDVGNGPGRMRLEVQPDGKVQCFVTRKTATGNIGTLGSAGVGMTASRVGVISRNGNTDVHSVTLFGRD